jgi:ATP-dependent RNA helicase DDX21
MLLFSLSKTQREFDPTSNFDPKLKLNTNCAKVNLLIFLFMSKSVNPANFTSKKRKHESNVAAVPAGVAHPKIVATAKQSFSSSSSSSSDSDEDTAMPAKKFKTESKTVKQPSQLPSSPSSSSSESDSSDASDEEVKPTFMDGRIAPVSGSENPPLSAFRVPANIIQNLNQKNITNLFPIQAATFNHIFDGEDVVGRARTGTGKTLAFALPVACKLQEDKTRGRLPRVVILLPTRELALQVCKEFKDLTPALSCECMYGGAPYGPQESAIRRGVDVVVGTCGRVDDLLTKGTLKFDNITTVILDECDEMLNMGFADSVESILSKVPGVGKDGKANKVIEAGDQSKVQTLLFSATMPTWVAEIASKYLRKNKREIDLVSTQELKTSTLVRHIAIACHWSERNAVMGEVMRVHGGRKMRTIIFCETKKEANELVMEAAIPMECQPLHGDIAQTQRQSTLDGFRQSKFDCLVATDVAARGIDIPDVEMVIQCEPPDCAETYIHRSGRTGRAGKKGVSIVFYTPKQMYLLSKIERMAGVKFERGGAPQMEEIYKAAAVNAAKDIQKVDEAVIEYFKKSAEDILATEEASTVLACALAALSGHYKPLQQRSLLSSTQGAVTILLTSNVEIRGLTFVWNMIRRFLIQEPDEVVKGMRLTADRKGAVFDVPMQYKATIASLKQDKNHCKFSVPSVLPPLVGLEPNGGRGGDRSWNRNSSGSSAGSSRGGVGLAAGRGGRGRGGSFQSQSGFGSRGEVNGRGSRGRGGRSSSFGSSSRGRGRGTM